MLLLTLLACDFTLDSVLDAETDHDEETDHDHDEETDHDGETDHDAETDIGCETVEALPDGQILAIGDSMFDFIGDCADAPDLVGVTLGARVTNEAVGGATMLDDIPGQYYAEDWRWVIINGGGNDMDCDSESACLAILDAVESAWRDLIEAVTDDGAQVALVGYPDFSEDSESGALWAELGGEMMERMSGVADAHDGVFFVDLREAMSGAAQPELFDADLIHPSPAGARVIADEIARVIGTTD